MSEDFAVAQPLLDEHAQLEKDLADPDLHSNAGRARSLGRRYAELGRVVAAYRTWEALVSDVEAAEELAAEDPDFAQEYASLTQQRDAAADHLRGVLVPRDPDDGRDVILEIKAGEGGEESALFAGDLLRMYMHYADRAWDEYTRDEIFPRDGEASEAGVQALIETSALIRDLPTRARTHAADYIDRRWLAEALAR